jgi:hypothetical protein
MTPKSSATLMRIVAYSFLAFAAVWALAPYTPVSGPAHFLVDLLHWPLGDEPVPMSQNTMWLSSIGAGLVVALGIFLLGIVAPALENGDRRTIRVAIVAITGWYVVDSAGSIASGVASNAAFNTVFLIAVLVPLLAVRHEA